MVLFNQKTGDFGVEECRRNDLKLTWKRTTKKQMLRPFDGP